MTLGGAFREDVVALEAGVFQVLPSLDYSGRALLFLQPYRNTRKGYKPENLVSVEHCPKLFMMIQNQTHVSETIFVSVGLPEVTCILAYS